MEKRIAPTGISACETDGGYGARISGIQPAGRRQVRDSDFERQLHERLELAEREKQNAVELAKAKVSSDLQRTAAAKDAEIQELKSKLEASQVTQKLAVTEALSAVEKERDTLANALAQAEREKKAASELAEALLAGELHKVSSSKEEEIRELKTKLQGVELEKKLAVAEAVTAIAKERDELKNGIKQTELEKQLAEKALKDKYETQIKDRDDAIERLKDMKARLSTKMVDHFRCGEQCLLVEGPANQL
ncbi:DUF2130 domain-containing protein [Bradyrhizobium altum]|uniref:DUF2130 domain-containing protein n=1 Tax=Bradyrhizobium altum TaxID=1571202 RepID=UPI0024C03F1F|nr:DUF2130 domain-containing protein [Bradyrhizobium altum]